MTIFSIVKHLNNNLVLLQNFNIDMSL